MDLESVTDELYRLRPEEFTAARDRRAAQAVRDGDRQLASHVRALRRPTLAAWVSNLLVRERPDEAGALISLGEGLREAHRNLDGGQLRELSRRQRALVASLSRQAGRLADGAGHPVSDDVLREVEETLHAVLADPRAAQEWTEGRLSRPLTAVSGFPGLAPDAADRLAAAPSPSPPRPARGRGTGAQVSDLTEARERRRREQRRERLERARRLAEKAGKEMSAREEELDRVREAAGRADEAERSAVRRLEELATELGAAEDRRRTAREEAEAARDRLQEADRAWHAAREAAEAAEAEVAEAEAEGERPG
ncbi:hypothetical protein AB0F13_13590 [Streptomyces sp. NPDC026206]|uniref:hypothetical protein n=1 Tax=Streptomyces sp. NPDC026206 TaxID=3157089 RepID=UPI0033F033AA